jgi:hypothetical protein
MTTIYSERYESGGDGSDVAERRAALLRVLTNTATQCKTGHKNLFLECGGDVEMAATDPKPNTSDIHPFEDAIPRKVFRLAVKNSAGQRAGFVLSVGDNVSKFFEGAETVHTYEYVVETLPVQGARITFGVDLLIFPERFFRKAASDTSYHISLKESLVKELLVLSFMTVNGNVRGGEGRYDSMRGLRHLVSKHGAPFTYQPRGWLYHSKYGEAVFNGVTYKFETAENVAAFVNIINTPAAESTTRLLATAERLADIIAAI